VGPIEEGEEVMREEVLREEESQEVGNLWLVEGEDDVLRGKCVTHNNGVLMRLLGVKGDGGVTRLRGKMGYWWWVLVAVLEEEAAVDGRVLELMWQELVWRLPRMQVTASMSPDPMAMALKLNGLAACWAATHLGLVEEAKRSSAWLVHLPYAHLLVALLKRVRAPIDVRVERNLAVWRMAQWLLGLSKRDDGGLATRRLMELLRVPGMQAVVVEDDEEPRRGVSYLPLERRHPLEELPHLGGVSFLPVEPVGAGQAGVVSVWSLLDEVPQVRELRRVLGEEAVERVLCRLAGLVDASKALGAVELDVEQLLREGEPAEPKRYYVGYPVRYDGEPDEVLRVNPHNLRCVGDWKGALEERGVQVWLRTRGGAVAEPRKICSGGYLSLARLFMRFCVDCGRVPSLGEFVGWCWTRECTRFEEAVAFPWWAKRAIEQHWTAFRPNVERGTLLTGIEGEEMTCREAVRRYQADLMGNK
jgi:hypothetical protein